MQKIDANDEVKATIAAEIVSQLILTIGGLIICKKGTKNPGIFYQDTVNSTNCGSFTLKHNYPIWNIWTLNSPCVLNINFLYHIKRLDFSYALFFSRIVINNYFFSLSCFFRSNPFSKFRIKSTLSNTKIFCFSGKTLCLRNSFDFRNLKNSSWTVWIWYLNL